MRWVSLIVLVLSMATACQKQSNILTENKHASANDSETFTLEGVLTIQNGVGDITIHAGSSDNTVTVDYTKTAYGTSQDNADDELAAMEVTFEQDANGLTIDGRNVTPRGSSQSNKVDLTITVPATIQVSITNDVGDIQLEGLTTSDKLAITNDVGDIVIRNATTPSGMEVLTNVGAVSYAGTLGGEGTYAISANVGSVTIDLADSASVSLDIVTDTGSITAPDSLTVTEDTPGESLRGDLGDGGPMLAIRVNVGDVRIQ
jgi:hypothetical protein